MHAVRHHDPASFERAVGDWLRRDPIRHSLILRLLDTLIRRPEVYPAFSLVHVERNGRPVAAALRTPPHGIVLARPDDAEALEALVQDVRRHDPGLPGVVGGRPEADDFARRWAKVAGVALGRSMDQAVWVIETVAEVPVPPGAPRLAVVEDLESVLAWSRDFHQEAGLLASWDEAEERRRLASRLGETATGDRHFWHVDRQDVCLAGRARSGDGSVNVGPVYTPPAHRRRGYATALVAHLSLDALEGGAPLCLLYTDLANPTSNAIYQRIGYRRVFDSAMIDFVPAPGASEAGA